MAESTANNMILEATSVSPFNANYGFNPRFNAELSNTPSEPENLNVQEFGTHMNILHEFLRKEMRYAQDQYKTTTNASRTPVPIFHPSNYV